MAGKARFSLSFPYHSCLRGPLFQETPLDRQVLDLPDEAFAPILGDDGLFYRYDFSLEESKSSDHDAIDPEIFDSVGAVDHLGLTVERILTGSVAFAFEGEIDSAALEPVHQVEGSEVGKVQRAVGGVR